MTATPAGETAKDRRNQWYVGIVAVVALLAILGNVILGGDIIRITNNDHAASVIDQRKSLAQQKKIVQLEQQHGADIVNESQLLASLKSLDNGIIIPYVMNLDNALNSICAKAGAGCSISFNPPPQPAPSPAVPPVSRTPTPPVTPHVTPAPPAPAVPIRPGNSGFAPGHDGGADHHHDHRH